MPNHVTTTLCIFGPANDILRFRNDCIRVPKDDCPEEDDCLEEGECLDFQALVPEPPINQQFDDMTSPFVIKKDDGSCEWDWHRWRMAHWGTEWNCYAFSEESYDEESYKCTFDTAWNYPDGIISALANRYPTLEGTVEAKDPNMGWSLVGNFSKGKYVSQTCSV